GAGRGEVIWGTLAGGCGGSGAAMNPHTPSSAQLVILPVFVWVISTHGKAGAYFVLKLRLPAMRVAPVAVGSAPAPLRSRRAKSRAASFSFGASITATQA